MDTKDEEDDDNLPVLTDTSDSDKTQKRKPQVSQRKKASERKPLRRIKWKLPSSIGIACTEPCSHPRCLKMCMHELDKPHQEHY